jgi:DNA-binding NtrC family response regulator
MEIKTTYGNIIGASDTMRTVYDQIERVSGLDIPVLIRGESGTGKELVAQTIHRNSRRKGGPFVPINMGALSPELIESELFGHEAGAFTGASKIKKGKFELSKNGTIFLDEITTMEPKLQVSLLRIIESNRFQRVGGSKFLSTDSRIISATNDDIERAISNSTFREDLYYRLNVFAINLPPLRDRREDIPLLAEFFLKRYSEEFGRDGVTLSSRAVECLMNYPWPGNVRELENALIKALIMTNSGEISKEYLPRDGNEDEISSFTIEVGTTMREAEKRLLLETLQHEGGNKSQTAKVLQISRKALYNKMVSYELEPLLDSSADDRTREESEETSEVS